MYKIEKLEWDSGHFGMDIGTLKFNEEDNSKNNHYDVIFAKIETNRFDIIEKLENEKFNLKDILIIFSGDNLEGQNNSNIKILKKNNLEEVLKLCENTFLESHFYKNKNFSKEQINNLYKNWIINKFNLGQRIYIFIEKEKIIGFLLEKKEKSEVSIDLIAVKKEKRGQQIGEKLIKFFIYKHKGKKIFVGTQLTNKSAIRLYERLGFRFEKTINIYHKNKE